jgi:hypothetical protein
LETISIPTRLRVLTVQHTPETGTIVLDTEKSDKAAQEVFKQRRLRWSSQIGEDGAWFIPRTRDKISSSLKLNPLVDGLVNAGYGVRLVVDDTQRRSRAEAETERAQRAEGRADRYRERADKSAETSARLYSSARERAEVIPLGQPILVGHHSEHRDRRYRDRINRTYERAFEESNKASDLTERADIAQRFQARHERLDVILRRIERLEVSRRGLVRDLAKTRTEKGRNRLNDAIAIVDEDLQHWREVVAEREANGEKVWRPEDFKPGDFAGTEFGWCEVLRVNKKTLTIPSISTNLGFRHDVIATELAQYNHTETRPYDKITGRRPGDDPQIRSVIDALKPQQPTT